MGSLPFFVILRLFWTSTLHNPSIIVAFQGSSLPIFLFKLIQAISLRPTVVSALRHLSFYIWPKVYNSLQGFLGQGEAWRGRDLLPGNSTQSWPLPRVPFLV